MSNETYCTTSVLYFDLQIFLLKQYQTMLTNVKKKSNKLLCNLSFSFLSSNFVFLCNYNWQVHSIVLAFVLLTVSEVFLNPVATEAEMTATSPPLCCKKQRKLLISRLLEVAELTPSLQTFGDRQDAVMECIKFLQSDFLHFPEYLLTLHMESYWTCCTQNV